MNKILIIDNRIFLRLLSFVFLFLIERTSAQTRGFIQEDIIKVSNIVSDNQIYELSNLQKQTTRSYYDGLGRIIQTVALQASPLQNDLIQPISYDNLGRQSKNYLPYTGKNTDVTGSYRPNAISTDQPDFYNNTTQYTIATDSAPYTQEVFEDSPLQRTLRSGTVGQNFQPLSGQHFKTLSYRANNATDGNILIWNPDGTYTSGNYYTANVLSVTDGKDEDNKETLSYNDLSGHTILKREIIAGVNLDTYYVYNAAGMISYIIPPKAMALMIANGNFSLAQTGVKKLIFHYVYNTRGQLIEKTVPGKGTTYTVYDPLNRPVLVQDANLTAGNKWNYIKYDASGRVISQGIYTDAVNITRTLIQAYVNTGTIASNYNANWYEGRSTAAANGYYTNTVFPTANITPLTYNYYDDYDLDNDGIANYAYIPQSLTNEAVQTTASIKDLPTITSTRTVGNGLGNIWLLSVTFYDKKYNAIQTQSNNQLNYTAGIVTDYTTIAPDFMGVQLINKVSKKTGTSTTISVQTNFTYDHTYRVKTISQQYNGGTASTVAAYSYNELGQLIRKKLNYQEQGEALAENITLNATQSVLSGATMNIQAKNSITLSPGFVAESGSSFHAAIAGDSFLQAIDYRYNIRGQLLSINNSKLASDGGITNTDTNDLFGMQFLYDKTDNTLSNTASFNGKLSAVKWMNKDGSGVKGYERAYLYSYDGIDRYKGATYAERPSTSTANFTLTHGWDETGITYDTGGNILSLTRNSSTQAAGTFTQVDNLVYTYDPANPNQLQKITDGTGAAYIGAGFRNLTGSTGNYSYDVNSGSLTADPYKGITSITYNDLNRTNRISLSATQYIDYTYNADGILLKKQAYKSGTTTQVTDYIDGFVFDNSSGTEILSYFAMPEGRVLNTAGILKQEFVIADQQGNARVSFQNNGSGTAIVRQENSYYGFGLVMTNSSVGTLGDSNKKLYNGGSEWQNDFGNLPDYYQTYYRNYDAAIGRFIAVDPVAESAESMTVYHYAGNNPISYNDPMGDFPKSGRMSWEEMTMSQAERSISEGFGRTTGVSNGGGSLVSISFLNDLFSASNNGARYSNSDVSQIFNVYSQLQPGDQFQLNYHDDGGLGILTNTPYLTGILLPEIKVSSTSQISSAVRGAYDNYWANKGGLTAESFINGLLKMRVGQSRSGEEIAALDKRLGPVKRVLNQVTRVNSGIKVDLKWTANIALKVIPNAPKISDGAIISITTETWVDRINSVLHLRSNDIQINYDGKMVPLNIYINNNGYTMERVASPSYYSIFKGTWK